MPRVKPKTVDEIRARWERITPDWRDEDVVTLLTAIDTLTAERDTARKEATEARTEALREAEEAIETMAAAELDADRAAARSGVTLHVPGPAADALSSAARAIRALREKA